MQTVALRIICERESEIEAFVPVEYWTLDATLEGKTPPAAFHGAALVVRRREAQVRRLGPAAARTRRPRCACATTSPNAVWTVASVESSERRKNPAPPFITSQLQQAAARRLGFAVRRTMQIAQRLYEGREIPGRGTVGLITYMRTDSTRVSQEALTAVREHIGAQYGAESMPESPRYFKSRRDTQDAHEAIRPTYLDLPPEEVARHVAADEAKLYRLIWQRFVASQMSPAVYDTTSAEITAGRAVYRASGSTLKFAGLPRGLRDFGRGRGRHGQGHAEAAAADAGRDVLKLVEVAPEKKETQPPPRFNEASLVKFLEENGIGRPSTYVEILRKIEERRYVHRRDRRFIPTALGRTVIELLIPYFDDFFETSYTARMEEALDEVEEGKLSWTKALAEFDKTFTRDRNRALEDMVSGKAGILLAEAKELKLSVVPKIDEKCPTCGKKLKLRMGKNGLFVACSGYPGCTYTLNIPDPEEDVVDVSEIENTTCDECGSPMKVRQSRTGSTFLGCTAYPKCRNVVNIAVAGGKAEARPDEPTGEMCPRCGNALVRRHGRYGAYVSCSNYPACKFKPPKPIKDTGVRCPKDGGIVAERRGRFRPFYGCVNYPNCDFSLSVRPIPEACPQCGNPYLLFRERKSGAVFACDKAGCGFEKPAGELPPIVEFTPEAPPEVPGPVVTAAVAKKTAKPKAKKAAPKAKKAAKA